MILVAAAPKHYEGTQVRLVSLEILTRQVDSHLLIYVKLLICKAFLGLRLRRMQLALAIHHTSVEFNPGFCNGVLV